MDKRELLKSHIDSYTRKDGTVVQAHDNKVQKKADPLPASHSNAVVNKHPGTMVRKGSEWAKAGGKQKAIPAADVEKFPEYTHAEVYGHDNKTSPEGDDFSKDFKAKHDPSEHPGFVIKHKDGQRHFVDTQGYGYARYHAPVDDSAGDGGFGEAVKYHGSKEKAAFASGWQDANYKAKGGEADPSSVPAELKRHYDAGHKLASEKAAKNGDADSGMHDAFDDHMASAAAKPENASKPAKPKTPKAKPAAKPAAPSTAGGAEGDIPPLHAHIDKLRAKADASMKAGGGDWKNIETRDGAAMHSAADALEAGDHEKAGAVIRNNDTALRDEIMDHVHPKHWSKMGMDPINLDKSIAKYEKMHGKPGVTKAAEAAPETKTQNEGYGFHGEAATAHLKAKYGNDDYYGKATEQDHYEADQAANKKFSDMAHHLVKNGHFDNHEQARDYLDSTHGRHLHDGATFHGGDATKVQWLGKDVAAYKKKAGLKKSIGAGSGDAPLDLLKSHVDAYTRKDGTAVRAHETKHRVTYIDANRKEAGHKDFPSKADADAHAKTVNDNTHNHMMSARVAPVVVLPDDHDGDGLSGDVSLDHPAYSAQVKLKGYNGKTTVHQAVNAQDGGKILRAAHPEWSAADHAKLSDAHRRAATAHDKEWDVVANEAAQQKWGRNFEFGDYKISGIGSDEFSARHKDKLRTLAHGKTKHRTLADAHAAAAKSMGLSVSSVDVQGADRYEFANGKKPGGKGSWIFSQHKTHDFSKHGSTAGEHFFQSAHNTTYSDAKKQAKEWAASKGHSTIHIQS